MTGQFLKAIGCKSKESILHLRSSNKLEKFIALTLKKVDPVFLITELTADGGSMVPVCFSRLDKFGQRAIIISVCSHILESVEADAQ